MGILSRLFPRKKWSKRQKEHRRLCRLEDQELERLANWMHLEQGTGPERLLRHNPHRYVKTTQEPKMTRVATHVPTDVDSLNVEAPEGLPDEFENNADPKGDACCYEPKCPCHGSDE